ncbi:hypothetical protein KUV89_08640 [Marinobacter hydrocarbonoclasticus]|nr:hypothetical protein [Marinobacter nauticus]
MLLLLFPLFFVSLAMHSKAGELGEYLLSRSGEQVATYSISVDFDYCLIDAELTTKGVFMNTTAYLSSRSECHGQAGWDLKAYKLTTEVLFKNLVLGDFYISGEKIEYSEGIHDKSIMVDIDYDRSINRVGNLSVIFSVRDKLIQGAVSWESDLVILSKDSNKPVIERRRYTLGCGQALSKEKSADLICVSSLGQTGPKFYWYRPDNDMAFVGSIKGQSILWKADE